MVSVPAVVVYAMKENRVIDKQYVLNLAKFWKSSGLTCRNKHSSCKLCATYRDLWRTVYVLAIGLCLYEVFCH